MRSSVKKEDPGYVNFINFDKYHVFLDGAPVPYCITADEEEGFVLVYELDENGRPFIELDEVPTKVMRGKVEILGDDEL